MMLKNLDLINAFKTGEIDVLVHGCNCFCNMGAGIARYIKNQYPQAFVADKNTKKGDRNKLGTYSLAEIQRQGMNTGFIVNAYTQYNFGGNKDNFSYDTFEVLLESLFTEFQGKKIGMPLLGCGLAGGKMNRIIPVLSELVKKYNADVVVGEINPKMLKKAMPYFE